MSARISRNTGTTGLAPARRRKSCQVGHRSFIREIVSPTESPGPEVAAKLPCTSGVVKLPAGRAGGRPHEGAGREEQDGRGERPGGGGWGQARRGWIVGRG